MIIQIAGFLLVVSMVSSVAAWAAEDGLGRLDLPARWVWLLAMLAGPVLLVLPLLVPEEAAGPLSRAVAVAPLVELDPLVVGAAPGAAWSSDFVVGVLWAGGSLLMLLVLLRSYRTLARLRTGWVPGRAAGRDVMVSEEIGPAVTGLRRPVIVLPRWVLSISEGELEMVVSHEEEHLRSRDPGLLAVGLALVAAMPWNPLSWWQLRRMRAAMEIDCDRRVLRRAPDRARYGRSLLTVAGRAGGPSLALAAFAEGPGGLKRRILAMTSRRSRWTPLRAAALGAVALATGLQACGVESPMVVDETRMASVDAPTADGAPGDAPAPETASLEDGPTFTPFTDPPGVVNPEEIIALLRQEYPPLLRDAGVEGTVRIYFFIDEEGIVQQVRLDESSGDPALDEAAMNVAGAYRFTPARNGDTPVPVWVAFPVTFRVR